MLVTLAPAASERSSRCSIGSVLALFRGKARRFQSHELQHLELFLVQLVKKLQQPLDVHLGAAALAPGPQRFRRLLAQYRARAAGCFPRRERDALRRRVPEARRVTAPPSGAVPSGRCG